MSAYKQISPDTVDVYQALFDLVKVANAALNEHAEKVMLRWRHSWWRRFCLIAGGCYSLILGLSLSSSFDLLWRVWAGNTIDAALPAEIKILKLSIALIPFLVYGWAASRKPNKRARYCGRISSAFFCILVFCILSLVAEVILVQYGKRTVAYLIMENLGFLIASLFLGSILAVFVGLAFKSPEISLYIDSLLQPAIERPTANREAIQTIAQYISKRNWRQPTVNLIMEMTTVELQSTDTLYAFLEVFLNLLPAATLPLILMVFTVYISWLTGESSAQFLEHLDASHLLVLGLAGFFVLLVIGAQVICGKIRHVEILKIIQTGCVLYNSQVYEHKHSQQTKCGVISIVRRTLKVILGF